MEKFFGGELVTLHEFNAGLTRYQRWGLVLLGMTGLMLGAYVIVVVYFGDALHGLGTSLFGMKYADLARPLALVPVVILMLGGSAFIHWFASKDGRVVCPHCKGFLAGGKVRLETLATRHCPLCGLRAIDD